MGTKLTQEQYLKAWTDKMVEIWQEKIIRYGIVDTGALHQKLNGDATENSSLLKFLSYGIYQAFGVGNGYIHGNGGNLKFLDPEYRKQHKLGKPRQRRNWLSPKLYSSVSVLQRAMAEMYAHDIINTVCDAIADERAPLNS